MTRSTLTVDTAKMNTNHNVENSAVELPRAVSVIGLLSLVLLLLEVVR